MINKNDWRFFLGCILFSVATMTDGQGLSKERLGVSSSSSTSESQEQEKTLVDTSEDRSKLVNNGSTSSVSSSSKTQERSLIISNGLSRGYSRQVVEPQPNSKSVNFASRNVPDVEGVFNRNKGAIYSLYSRALHDNKNLSGNVLLQLTILSSGEVGSCKILSSSMNDAEFVQKLLERIRLINFGAGDFRTATVVKQFEFLPEKPQEK